MAIKPSMDDLVPIPLADDDLDDFGDAAASPTPPKTPPSVPSLPDGLEELPLSQAMLDFLRREVAADLGLAMEPAIAHEDYMAGVSDDGQPTHADPFDQA